MDKVVVMTHNNPSSNNNNEKVEKRESADDDTSIDPSTVTLGPNLEFYQKRDTEDAKSLGEFQDLIEETSSDLLADNPLPRNKTSSMHHCQTSSFVDSEEASNTRQLKTRLIDAPRSQKIDVPITGIFSDKNVDNGTTVERLEATNKVDAACGGSYAARDGGRPKKTIKNFTSNLARKLSLKKAPKKNNDGDLFDTDVANGLPSPETSGIVSYEGLLRLFACPSCEALMTPPFAQCKKGHLVCGKCRVTSKGTCPSCKQRITENPNFMMEQVYRLVRFPCQFFKMGCLEYHSPSQKTLHEQFCPHRPIHCHFEAEGCTVILPLKDIQSHIGQCSFNRPSC